VCDSQYMLMHKIKIKLLVQNIWHHVTLTHTKQYSVPYPKRASFSVKSFYEYVTRYFWSDMPEVLTDVFMTETACSMYASLSLAILLLRLFTIRWTSDRTAFCNALWWGSFGSWVPCYYVGPQLKSRSLQQMALAILARSRNPQMNWVGLRVVMD
jgi:hypothetical protein